MRDISCGPVLRALFMKNTGLTSKWFEIRSKCTNNHLFDGIMFYKKHKEPMALAEFGGSQCSNDKVESDTLKVYRNACRVINELATKTKNGYIPTVFIVLFHQPKLRFESLKLIDNDVYVRTRHASIMSPTRPEDIKTIFSEMPKIFSWRDAIIKYEESIYDGGSNTASPDCTFEALSV